MHWTSFYVLRAHLVDILSRLSVCLFVLGRGVVKGHFRYLLCPLSSFTLLQVISLEKKCQSGSQKIQECQKKIEETWSLAREEAAKCKAAKEVIKALALRVRYLVSSRFRGHEEIFLVYIPIIDASFFIVIIIYLFIASFIKSRRMRLPMEGKQKMELTLVFVRSPLYPQIALLSGVFSLHQLLRICPKLHCQMTNN